MKSFITSVVALASLAASVSAHGYVQSTIVAGKKFSGFLPFTDLYQKPSPGKATRRIPGDGPIFRDGLSSPGIVCNSPFSNAWTSPTHVPVNAGQDFTFEMDRWPHDHKGPITTWLASCGGDSCENFNPTGKTVWFKINQVGLRSGNTEFGEWATEILIANNNRWTVKIPSGLKAGAYLIRIDILALHAAGAPQFYPSCTQIRVGGGGNRVPASGDLHRMESVYNMGQSGLSANIWNRSNSYTIAGPRVAALAEGSSTSSSTGGSSSGGSSASAGGGKKSCKAKRSHPKRAHRKRRVAVNAEESS